ncbi:Outer membrane lipoprotein Blc precursor [Mycolicibacterium chlorophenolicum]|uniref:Outer membrane lipoprotein Blc n=2 Tax=Mycolicibacterium chlorophenolicum TaxID=37916 RepID=A0A0J6Y0Q9_9MYCO|nr:Outer membrane lipoprotein Blc precursor [Mycolicibacterium chlorophenolicum]
MIMKRWQFSLVTCVAGACLAFGVGAGIAAADSGASGEGASSSQAAERGPASETREAPARPQRSVRKSSDAAERTPLFRPRAERQEPETPDAKPDRKSATTQKPLWRWKARTTATSEATDEATPERATATTRDRSPGPVATAMLGALSTLSGAARPAAAPQPPVTVPSVDVDRYLGTWYEVGSVKQFFSLGLVNTKAEYSRNTDGSIKVVNSGNYFFDRGPKSSINGAALPVDDTNAKLNVAFFGRQPSATPPGNYWVVDLGSDYDYAIVTDPTGRSGFILSRTPTVTAEQYKALVAQAKADGVRGWITKTRQPGARSTALA